MRYLIVTKNQPPFFTNWFDAENNFDASVDMIVFDLQRLVYTENGTDWVDIEKDSLW